MPEEMQQDAIDCSIQAMERFNIEKDIAAAEQEIHAASAIQLQRTDASRWDLDELKLRVAEAHRRPFQLGAGPVLRAELFTRSAEDHVLLLSMHHIACDALSFWTIIEEIQAAYAGNVLPPVRASYADFVRWQREMLAGPEGEELWNFWRRQLPGEVPALNLPTDFPRPAVQSFRGASHSISIGADLTRKVRDLARSPGATLHNTLLAVFAALLGRYTGQSEVVIGCATAGRPAGFAGVVGYFTNPIPVRVEMAGDPGFSALLAQVRRKTFDGIEHQQMPFALLVQRLQPKRDLSRSPIYQADFSVLKPPPAYRNGADAGAFPDLSRTVIRLLGRGEYVGQFATDDKALQARLFATPEGNVMVLWAPQPTAVTLPCAAERVTVADVFGYGEPTQPVNGKLTVKAGPEATYIVGLDDGILPHSRSFDEPEEMEEERRLFYVGITRAKDRLYLIRSVQRGGRGYAEETYPSRFLDDLPEDLIVGKSRSGRGLKARASESLWAASSRTLKAAPVMESKFRAGTRVKHPMWGDGIVLDSKMQDDDEIVDIVFESVGIKRLAASLANLKVL